MYVDIALQMLVQGANLLMYRINLASWIMPSRRGESNRITSDPMPEYAAAQTISASARIECKSQLESLTTKVLSLTV